MEVKEFFRQLEIIEQQTNKSKAEFNEILAQIMATPNNHNYEDIIEKLKIMHNLPTN